VSFAESHSVGLLVHVGGNGGRKVVMVVIIMLLQSFVRSVFEGESPGILASITADVMVSWGVQFEV